MVEQYMPKWVWRIMTAHYDNKGKLHFDYLEYYMLPEKLILASLRKEGWELVRVVPIKAKNTEVIKHDKYRKIKEFLHTWLKYPRNSDVSTVTIGGTYYFKRLE
jgi:hypothetical protein